MYQYQINLGDDNNNEKFEKTNFFEEDQNSKLGLTGFANKENNIKSKLNQILDKYRAPPQIEITPENKKNEVESILSNIENMISKNNANKPNELESYFNKDENVNDQNANINNNNNNNYNNNQIQISKLNVSHIKKNSIYHHDNNNNNLNVSGNGVHNNFKGMNQNDENMQFSEEGEHLNYYVPAFNPYLHLIIEVDVMENLMFEANKRNKFSFKTDYTSSFYVPDNYEIFVYDPFINFNFNSNLNSMNIKNINNNRLNFYKNLQQQQLNIVHIQNAHSVNYENFNNNAFMEKLNTSNLDNNIRNINNTSVRGDNSNLKMKNEVNYFINNEGEVEMEDNLNVANFAANADNNTSVNAHNNMNNAPALICFSSKKNDISPIDNNLQKQSRYELNFKKDLSKIIFFKKKFEISS